MSKLRFLEFGSDLIGFWVLFTTVVGIVITIPVSAVMVWPPVFVILFAAATISLPFSYIAAKLIQDGENPSILT